MFATNAILMGEVDRIYKLPTIYSSGSSVTFHYLKEFSTVSSLINVEVSGSSLTTVKYKDKSAKMSTVEYDLDTTGGMMPEIQALIAPPVSEESLRKSKRDKRRELGQSSYKRHGKTINHDCCDSCKESGSLLCCDRCPASFHLQCLDPPIDEEDLPSGEWMCHRCRVAPREPDDDDLASTCSEQSSERNSHVSDKLDGADSKFTIDELDREEFSESSLSNLKDYDKEKELAVGVALRKGRRQCTLQKKKPETAAPSNREGLTNVANNGNGATFKSGMKPIVLDCDEGETALKTLIKVASIMNPKQFQLPPELNCTIQLPGSRKRSRPKDNRLKKPPHELDNGLVPLPVKLCFECRRSCKKAPLLQCDYCPLLFHLDCLNPPLTFMPAGRWMCPNHVEHTIDHKLLKSVKLTERVKLWNRFVDSELSHDAVKVQFLKKVHRVNPPFRYKLKLPPSKRVQVPNAIKEHYKYRPPLLPRITKSPPVVPVSFDRGIDSSSKVNSASSDHELWLSSVVSLHCSIAKALADKDRYSKQAESSKIIDADVASSKESKTDDANDQRKKLDDDDTKSAVEQKCDDGGSIESSSVKHEDGGSVCALSASGDDEDGAPRQQLPAVSSKDNSVLNNNESLKQHLQDSDFDLSKLDDNIVRLLAFERLNQLVSKTSTEKSKPRSAEKSLQELSESKAKLSKPGSSEVRARAIITPINSKEVACVMSYRCLNIGLGADTDLCLTKYGCCSYVSGKHAAIFYDETTKHYELLNYSEHGTTVDNVLYSCDFSEKKAPTPAQPNTIVSSVRSIIDRNRGRKRHVVSKNRPVTMSSTSRQNEPCVCKTSGSNLIGGSGAGWEGTALLHHGSYIKCGCIQFIFSIVDGSLNSYSSSCINVNGEPAIKSAKHNQQ